MFYNNKIYYKYNIFATQFCKNNFVFYISKIEKKILLTFVYITLYQFKKKQTSISFPNKIFDFIKFVKENLYCTYRFFII